VLNRAVNGAPNSAHLMGYAADFVCPAAGTPLEIVTKIKSSYIHFDQCIQEGTWVHISFDPKARNEVLTAHFGPNGTSYTKGHDMAEKRWISRLLTDKNGDADELVVFGLIAIIAMSIALVRNATAGAVDLSAAGIGYGTVITAVGLAVGARDGWPGTIKKDGG